jgi:hypothetical protein
MGTNFYFIGDEEGIEKHIGKRSAAGMFCWDCGLSLCGAGHDEVHRSAMFLPSCAVCGEVPQKESLTNGAMGRELGFNWSKPERKNGVASASSFSWAMSPGHFADLKIAPNLHIENEYRSILTLDEFSWVLSECPIMFFHSIGMEFS